MYNTATTLNSLPEERGPASSTNAPLIGPANLRRLYHLYTHVPSMASGFAIWNIVAVAALVLAGPAALFATLIPYIFGVLMVTPRQPFVGLMLFFAYFSVEGMYKYASQFSTAIYAIAPAMMVFVLFNWISRTGGKSIKTPPGAASLYLFVAIALMQCFNPKAVSVGSNSVISGFVTAFLWYIGPMLMYFLTYNTVRESRFVLLFFYLTIGVSTVVSAVAILQLIMGQTWTWAHFPGVQLTLQSSTSYYRPPSTTAIGAGGCQWARYGVILPLGLLATGYVRSNRRQWLLVFIVINLICLIISGVRLLAFQSACDVIFFVLLTAKNQQAAFRSAFACAAGAAVAIYVAGFLTGGKVADRFADTLQNPLERYQLERGQNIVSFQQFVMAYPLGQGYQRGLANWQDRNAADTGEATSGENFGALRDTAFGALAQDVGLPGLTAITIAILVLIYRGYIAYRCLKTKHMRALGSAMLALMIGLVPGGFAGPVLQGAFYFWIVAGLLLLLPEMEAREFLATPALDTESTTATAADVSAVRVSPSTLRRLEREAAAEMAKRQPHGPSGELA